MEEESLFYHYKLPGAIRVKIISYKSPGTYLPRDTCQGMTIVVLDKEVQGCMTHQSNREVCLLNDDVANKSFMLYPSH